MFYELIHLCVDNGVDGGAISSPIIPHVNDISDEDDYDEEIVNWFRKYYQDHPQELCDNITASWKNQISEVTLSY